MQVAELAVPGLRLIRPDVFEDARGFVFESYNAERHRAAGITCTFVQDNFSHSVKATLRGLHYQDEPGQAKLVSVTRGCIFDVAVDIRPASPTLGRWVGVVLDAASREQLFLPKGFAHGFCVLSDAADVVYKLSSPYRAESERCLAWNDPELAIDWPIQAPLLSERDSRGESFASYRARIAP
jgi:dTDP-4-dehydrorhamnose 3,5-epimerase